MSVRRSSRSVAAWLALAAIATVPSFSSEGRAEGPSGRELVEQWARATSPGEHHEELERFVGRWSATLRVWRVPDQPPIVSRGFCEYKLVLGNRYLVQTLEGVLLGEPFNGIGLRGYDNVLGKHTAMWIDNKGTSMLYSEGECSTDHREETHRAQVRSPLGGADQSIRMVTRVISPDRHVTDFFSLGPDGREFKSMEVTYDRM